jgi:serine/threonine-protein kinase HipA
MTAGRCTLEVYVDGAWRLAAEVRCDNVAGGFRSATRLEYDFDYLEGADALDTRDLRAVSCRYPVGYGIHVEDTWPAFLLDVVPSGAARRFWERELGLPNAPSSDWAVLAAGGGNPPGNVRVRAPDAGAAEQPRHPGFSRDDVLARAEGFIEYARAQGASIAGGSGAAGDAPKFLLREDHQGLWHADGALADEHTARSWIVKFPRSPRAADRLVLESEAPYYAVAARLGARTGARLAWEQDCLFVPRFDRPARPGARIARLGLESLCALAGVADFGAPIPKEELATSLARFVSDPERELRELLLRDVLDVALGNTDNHARNSAVLKHEDGTIELSPLYDFAPMVLDPQGIARVCRWRHEEEGYPIWRRVAEGLDALGLDAISTKAWLRELSDRISELPSIMSDEGVPARVTETLSPRIARTARTLAGIA